MLQEEYISAETREASLHIGVPEIPPVPSAGHRTPPLTARSSSFALPISISNSALPHDLAPPPSATMMYAQHRPPSAPRTPDNDGPLWAQSQSSGPHNPYPQMQYGMHPGGGAFDRSRFGPSPSPYAPSTSSAGGGGPGDAHLAGLGGPASRSPMPGNGPTPAPALLGHNLAAHLNNPPSLPTQGGGPSPYPTAPGQGQHSLLVPPSVSPAPGMSGAGGMGPGGAGAGLSAAGMGGSGAPGGGKLLLMPNGSAPPAGSEEEKIYVLISQLLKPETRETALVELSKKREMYDDLALVLWGGFGESFCVMVGVGAELMGHRRHGLSDAGDCFGLPCIEPGNALGTCFEPSLQRLGTLAVCRQSCRDKTALP